MKIAFVAQPFDVVPPDNNSSSLAIWIDEMSRKIARHEEVIVYSRKTVEFDDTTTKEKVLHRRITTSLDDFLNRLFKRMESIALKVFKNKTSFYYRYYYFKWYYYFVYITLVARQAKRDKVDVIVVLNSSHFMPILKWINKRVKTVLVMQCDWLIEFEPKKIRRRLKSTDVVVGCSDYIAQGVKSKFPQFQEKCHTVYNGSSQSVFNNQQKGHDLIKKVSEDLSLTDEKIILFVGRITPEKGIHNLIEAMKIVSQTNANWRLLIVGGFYSNPPSPASLRSESAELDMFESLKEENYETYLKNLSQPIKDQVEFVGPVSHYQLPVYYGLCDLFVHPSIWNEPFGMFLTEAMSCERPVISTYSGGIPEIVVDGKTGLLVQPNDVHSLAEAIVRLLTDSEQGRQMGLLGKRIVQEKFSWEKSSETFLSILNK